jgi:hypothetical protein
MSADVIGVNVPIGHWPLLERVPVIAAGGNTARR